MNPILRETFSARHIVAALLISAMWLAVAILEQYPTEDWVGVVVVGYLVWRVLNEVVFRLAQYGVRKILAYAQTVYDRKDMELPSGNSGSQLSQIIAVAYIYSLGLVISGLMIIISPEIINAVGLPSLELDQSFGLIMSGIGGAFVIAFFGLALIRLIQLNRSRSARHLTSQAVVVSDDKLARSNFPVLASP